MKCKLLLALILIGSVARSQTSYCPKGDSHLPKMIFADSLKNRAEVPGRYELLGFEGMYTHQLGETFPHDGVTIDSAYVLEVQDGGVESCNCHSKINRDTHIYIVSGKSVTKKSEAVIIEVTPRFRKQFGTTAEIKKKFKGHMVQVSGYFFEDAEHKMNSTVDKGKSLLWRHSLLEVHPVTEIKIQE